MCIEQANIQHREDAANNKKKQLLNLSLKVINYDREIMDRIFRNTSELSKAPSKSNPSLLTTTRNVSSPEQQESPDLDPEATDLEFEFKYKHDLLV
jgi:hypothetical protein